MNFFQISMNLATDSSINPDEAWADKQLIIASSHEMARKLADAREKGRHGWHDSNVCSIDYLYELRDKALEDNDHVSVMNYTAMIAMRESVQ
ncbi:hypothetical protein COHAPHLL_00024 [Vibrio phage V09]|uniref:Uncharacterized protein n=1 Tax=Vibrio phage V09 TaxID=2724327 RepID=A0A6H0X903_9CAUD|nr:hypothetical protein COHAPHLL_00024 [Vibrio phage V09]